MPNVQDTHKDRGYTAVLKAEDGVIVMIDRKSYRVPVNALNYPKLVEALRKAKPRDVIQKLAELPQTIVQPTTARAKQKMLVHGPTGKQFARTTIVSLVAKVGQRQAALTIGVPRSTVQDWVRPSG